VLTSFSYVQSFRLWAHQGMILGPPDYFMIQPTLSFLCDTRRELKDGTYPIKLTVYCLSTKKRYANESVEALYDSCIKDLKNLGQISTTNNSGFINDIIYFK